MRGRGSDDVTTVHHLFDFCQWRCPNGEALQLRKVADSGLIVITTFKDPVNEVWPLLFKLRMLDL